MFLLDKEETWWVAINGSVDKVGAECCGLLVLFIDDTS
jgi:hypothetical protein